MMNEEILQKAIEKAIDNGYQCEQLLDKGFENRFRIEINGVGYFLDTRYVKDRDAWWVIFSHDFARAFFGVDYTKDYYDTTPETGWAWHLQQMVIEPEPLKYLARFLKEEPAI